MKICLIYNFAQHYRAGIFKLIDREYQCDFYFGENKTDIKSMDYSVLNGTVFDYGVSRFGPIKYEKGLALLAFKGYDAIILLIEPKSISNWLLLLNCKLFSKTKVYGWTHGWYGKESFMRSIIKKIQFRLADGLLLYGNHAKELMRKEGFSEKHLHVIHNSLDYENQIKIRKQLDLTDIYRSHFSNENKNLIFIGRLTPVKQLDKILIAVANLKVRGEYYNITFVGDGSEKESLMVLSSKLDIDEQVWFYGACYDDNKNAELIYNADLCVAPGNVGLTAMHTMVFGTPVLTHDNLAWQMPEFESIKTGVTGDFFKYEDQKSLEDKISNWFGTQSDREATRKACFNEIDQYWTPEFQINVIKSVIK